MKLFSTHPMAIAQGELALFSDFENDGEMWAGTGLRERRKPVTFDTAFRSDPLVHINVSLWDVDTASAMRAEVQAENITPKGFDAVFRTWSDTRIARIRVAWMAIGEMSHDDDWDVS